MATKRSTMQWSMAKLFLFSILVVAAISAASSLKLDQSSSVVAPADSDVDKEEADFDSIKMEGFLSTEELAKVSDNQSQVQQSSTPDNTKPPAWRMQKHAAKFVWNPKPCTSVPENPIDKEYILRGGDGFIQLGDWRIGKYDVDNFSISSKNGRTAAVFRADGTVLGGHGTRTDFGLWDKPITFTVNKDKRSVQGWPNVVFGNSYIEFGGSWRLGAGDVNHLSIASKMGLSSEQRDGGLTSRIWRADGTVHDGPRSCCGLNQLSTYAFNQDDATIRFGSNFIQIGNFRIADIDGGHFSIANSATGKTAEIFRTDSTEHMGPRSDYNCNNRKSVNINYWQNKFEKNCETLNAKWAGAAERQHHLEFFRTKNARLHAKIDIELAELRETVKTYQAYEHNLSIQARKRFGLAQTKIKGTAWNTPSQHALVFKMGVYITEGDYYTARRLIRHYKRKYGDGFIINILHEYVDSCEAGQKCHWSWFREDWAQLSEEFKQKRAEAEAERKAALEKRMAQLEAKARAESHAKLETAKAKGAIMWHTRHFKDQQVADRPRTATESMSLFCSLPETTDGYCGPNFTTSKFEGIQNQVTCRGQRSFNNHFGAYMSASFIADVAGDWSFRIGVDFTFGNSVFWNGEAVSNNISKDLWWNNDWNNQSVVSFTKNLKKGERYTLSYIGFEVCCDGKQTVQFKNSAVDWISIEKGKLDLVEPEALNCNKFPKFENMKCPYGNGANVNNYSGSWSNLPNFSAMTPTGTDHVSIIQEDRSSFRKRGLKKNFGSRYQAWVVIEKTGQWSFSTNSRGGSRLYIDNNEVVNNDGRHGMRLVKGNVHLTRGKHRITVDYFQTRKGGLTVSFQGPGQAEATIPRQNLCLVEAKPAKLTCPDGSGVSTSFYRGGCWDALHNLDNINVDKRSVALSINHDSAFYQRQGYNECFAARYESKLKVESGGHWCFWTVSDDGSKLWIDGTQIVNNDGLHGMRRAGGCVNLQRGLHILKAEMFQKKGGAGMIVEWRGPNVVHQAIPNNAFCKANNKS